MGRTKVNIITMLTDGKGKICLFGTNRIIVIKRKRSYVFLCHVPLWVQKGIFILEPGLFQSTAHR